MSFSPTRKACIGASQQEASIGCYRASGQVSLGSAGKLPVELQTASFLSGICFNFRRSCKIIASGKTSVESYGGPYRWHISKTPIDMPIGCHATIIREIARTCLKLDYITEQHSNLALQKQNQKKHVISTLLIS